MTLAHHRRAGAARRRREPFRCRHAPIDKTRADSSDSSGEIILVAGIRR